MVPELEYPDVHHANAAQGWLELGMPREALAELQRMSAVSRRNPIVLEIEWRAHSAGQSWSEACKVANQLVEESPESPTGWIHRAYSARRMAGGGLEQAQTLLRPAMELFPEESIIPYNLACYAAQLGQSEKAWELFVRSLSVSANKQALRSMALKDEDLRLLWDRIETLPQH